MKAAHKGQLVGLLTGVTIPITWATAITNREGDCLDPGRGWPDGCQRDPITAGTLAAAGMVVIIPCIMIAGSMLGSLATRLHHARHLVLTTIAAALALVLAALAASFRDCSTDPTTTTLFVRALVPTLFATLVLERATRPAPTLARARIRDTSRLRRDIT